MSNVIGGRWKITELLAVTWSPEMAARFPAADHAGCLQQMRRADSGHWQPFDPPRCMDWHCNRCGASTNSFGHHDCPDRPAS